VGRRRRGWQDVERAGREEEGWERGHKAGMGRRGRWREWERVGVGRGGQDTLKRIETKK
jgi:hypothetical protein